MTEVGVAIALKRQNQLLAVEKSTMKPKEKAPPKPRPKKESPKPSNGSWQLLLEGVALYGLCLVLPTLLGVVVRWGGQWWKENRSIQQVTEYACSYSFIETFQFCKTSVPDLNELDESSVSLTDALAPDAGASDLGIVVLLSLSMAVVRVALAYFLVPKCLEQPKRLEALVRCKSVHLLSSSYPKTVTPKPSFAISNDIAMSEVPPMPNLAAMQSQADAVASPNKTTTSTTASSSTPLNVQIQPRSENSPSLQGSFSFPFSSLKKQVNHDDPQASDSDWFLIDDDENMEPAPAVSSGLMTSSSAQSLQALLQQATTATPPTTTSDFSSPNELDRLFAAPKYATAVFRLAYCTVCCIIALVYFMDAEFWPPAAGGRGHTKHCWDLSSVGAVVMDSDFDQNNTVLRHFFLVQASYHFHSAPFHIVTSLLLWLVSTTSKNKEKSTTTSPKLFGIIPSGMITADNVKTFVQHCFAVGLIAATYLFSSTRRLAAIGMFTFDVSSWFLHLLQLCINARNPASPTWVSILHQGFVIPAFCYSRFYVFPFVLGYSALVESRDWLQQLENMFVPGSKLAIQALFVVWLCALMIMNIVYFRRLLNHPHVVQALKGHQRVDGLKEERLSKTS